MLILRSLSFEKKITLIDTCSAQNVLDPLLSLHMYIFIPKNLL